MHVCARARMCVRMCVCMHMCAYVCWRGGGGGGGLHPNSFSTTLVRSQQDSSQATGVPDFD